MNCNDEQSGRERFGAWLVSDHRQTEKEGRISTNVNGLRLVSNEFAGLSRTETGWEPESKKGKWKGNWREEQVRSVPRPWLVIFTRRSRRARAPPESQTSERHCRKSRNSARGLKFVPDLPWRCFCGLGIVRGLVE